MGNAPDSAKRLVDLSACNAQADHFDQNRKACPEQSRRVFLSPDYKEGQLHAEFLDPFQAALGSDMCETVAMIRARSWGSVPPFLPTLAGKGWI
jgi:hypothetical protein